MTVPALLATAAAIGTAGPDTVLWDALLKQYVTASSRVDYARLKQSGAAQLDRYLVSVAKPWPPGWNSAARKAALINAYNALTMRWIVAHYPVASIWRTPNPFTGARHTVDGRNLSLDAIETELRGMRDPRIHGALVCAARSCPPLRREAYTPERLDTQLDDNVRAWLGNRELNEYTAATRTARVSSIFKWYAEDFGAVREFLARYGLTPDARVRLAYQSYRWGLNDTSDLGKDYSQAQFLFDRARSVF